MERERERKEREGKGRRENRIGGLNLSHWLDGGYTPLTMYRTNGLLTLSLTLALAVNSPLTRLSDSPLFSPMHC